MKLESSRPGYYNVEKYGVPVNDLDCIGTISSFSATTIWLSLPRQGIWLRRREIEDYVALWRLIAHYTGTPTEPFETPEKAKFIMESLMMNEINPSETSKILAANIIRSLEAQPPSFASRPFLEVNARWLNGNKLCDALDLGRPSLYYWALMAGQCIFFMSICYFYRSIPALDQHKIKVWHHNSNGMSLMADILNRLFVVCFGWSLSRASTASAKRACSISDTYRTTTLRQTEAALNRPRSKNQGLNGEI